jgi:hypothetical protein
MLVRVPSVKFRKNPLSDFQVASCIQTNGHTDSTGDLQCSKLTYNNYIHVIICVFTRNKSHYTTSACDWPIRTMELSIAVHGQTRLIPILEVLSSNFDSRINYPDSGFCRFHPSFQKTVES